MDAKQIGEVIKEARKRKGKTQTQLGELLGVGVQVISDYEKGKVKVIPFEKRAKMSSVLNIPISELLYDNEEMACISTNEAVDELKENRLIKAVNAELEEWLCSGDTDYLYKAVAIIRAEIDNELQYEIDKLILDGIL
ncbi:helix-turn-helix domain-containing protein [Phascolarctobacterium succinatutens]|uniref:helix-turn-helix domain-containing protein n=1 Tax=Phascolarctobacterium succinatutens TaxID=626940 RepID=UPI0026F15442|nr:helix-turn-helix transcriptional regulator [Phascolarctobacterium succinatutens]